MEAFSIAVAVVTAAAAIVISYLLQKPYVRAVKMFSADGSVDPLSYKLKNAGAATAIGVVLGDHDGQPIDLELGLGHPVRYVDALTPGGEIKVHLPKAIQPVDLHYENLFGFLFRTELKDDGNRFRMRAHKTLPFVHRPPAAIARELPRHWWRRFNRDAKSRHSEHNMSSNDSGTNSTLKYPWRLETNDRYREAVALVMSLSTASLLLPVFLARDFLGIPPTTALRDVFSWAVYLSWAFLGASILAGIVFHYFSAKWIRLAWGQPVGFARIGLSEAFVEAVLDVSFLITVIGFIGGLCFTIGFFLTYAAPS